MPRQGLTATTVTEAGAQLADEIGFAHLTLAALARRVDVRTASLYSHVDDIDDLKTRIALASLAALADDAAARMAGHAGRDALAALGGSYRDYARAHPGRYASTRMPMSPQTAHASAGPRHAALTRAILRGYPLPESEYVHAVRFIGAALHGYIELEASESFSHSRPAAEVSWRRTIDAIDAALHAWPTGIEDAR